MAAAAVGAMLFMVFIFVGIGLLIAILYLLNLQNTLKAAAPENRKMPPANVWLLLIPIFSTYYMFVVAKRISETIKAEYASKGQVPDNPKPTYNVGMAMAIVSAISMLISLITFKDSYYNTRAIFSASSSGNMEEMMAVQNASAGGGALSMLGSVISLALLILWIVYWVQTAGYKNKMKSLPSNNADSQIFNQF
ncbi:MAG: hypothetical protein EOP54_08335 [Sphingobacteriales bacterium]|nr:MAG: hypothetical protein EOP54_08335 [Sphingobacteriales bacterium]